PLVSFQEAALETRGISTPSEIQSTLEQQFGVRILIVDRDKTVVGDSQQTLRGQQISELAERGLQPRPLSDLRYSMQRVRRGPNDVYLFSSAQGVFATSPGAGPFGFLPQYQAVIAVPVGDISSAWEALLPRLLLAGGAALAVGVLIAVLLARSITRPLQQVTQASEQMALGRYDQQIGNYGGDEVGRLTRAFNQMAREVSRSHRTLREFLANVSHELKTPLTSIQGFSQAMIDGTLQGKDDYVEAATIVNQESVRMRGLVDDLLYLSQVEAGQAVLQLEEVSANDLVIATRDRFRRRAQQNGA